MNIRYVGFQCAWCRTVGLGRMFALPPFGKDAGRRCPHRQGNGFGTATRTSPPRCMWGQCQDAPVRLLPGTRNSDPGNIPVTCSLRIRTEEWSPRWWAFGFAMIRCRVAPGSWSGGSQRNWANRWRSGPSRSPMRSKGTGWMPSPSAGESGRNAKFCFAASTNPGSLYPLPVSSGGVDSPQGTDRTDQPDQTDPSDARRSSTPDQPPAFWATRRLEMLSKRRWRQYGIGAMSTVPVPS